MARYGSGDDENFYSEDEPTQLSNYGYDQPPADDGAAVPWYRKPVALVSFGAVGAVLIALVIYGLARAITGDAPSEPTTSSLTPLTSSSAPGVAPTSTVAETTTASTEPTTTEPTTTTTTTTPTTTSPTTTTTTSPTTTVSTSTSTVTQTETQTVTETPPPPPTP